MEEESKHPFIVHLESLREDRGALAALRRGLGQPPGSVPAMYAYIVPWLPKEVPPWTEAAYYLIAALFAYHPAEGGTGNVGQHFAQVRAREGDDSALERRFMALLAAHPEDLPTYLRQAISFLKSKDVPINWQALFYDVQRWGHPDRYIQKRWARAFWGRRKQEADSG